MMLLCTKQIADRNRRLVLNNSLENIFARVGHCIDLYNLMPSKEVIVGVSGGKDSFMLTLSLRKLGYSVFPVVIDMGFKGFDSKRIIMQFDAYDIPIHIITAKNQSLALPTSERREIEPLFMELSFSQHQKPCTLCSRIKRILLIDYAKKSGICTIALGHHRDDFITTMMKDYYVNGYYKAIGEYEPDLFKEYVQNEEISFDRLEKSIENNTISTMSLLLTKKNVGVNVIRPMMMVEEAEIARIVDSMGINIVPSSCLVELPLEVQMEPITKREIVHNRLRDLYTFDKSLGDILLSNVLRCLDAGGKAKSNPRMFRSTLLPGFEAR